MFLFNSNKKRSEVQRLLARVINRSSSEIAAQIEGPREERRVNLTLACWVIPLSGGRPDMAKAFATVTREAASAGFSLIVQQPFEADEVLVRLQSEGQFLYLRGHVRHVDPLGAGIWHAGVSIDEVADAGDYPELRTNKF